MMIKKMKRVIALLTAMALLLVPMLSLAQEGDAFDNAIAAGKTLNIKMYPVIPAELVDAELSAMMNELSINASFATEPAGQVSFGAMLGDTVLGDLLLEVGEDGALYIRSTLLGEDVIRVAMEDAQLLLDKVLAFAVSAGMMTAEEADMIREHISFTAQQEEAPVQEQEASAQEQTITLNLSMLEILTMDYGPLMDAVFALAEKFTYTTEFAGTPDADKAAEYYGADLTGEDFAMLTDGLMKMIASSKTLSQMMDGMTVTTEMINEAFAMIKRISIGAYLDDKGELVHLTLLPTIAVDGGDLVGSLSYSRKTEAQKVTYALDLGAAVDPQEGEYTVLFNIPLTLTVDENAVTVAAEVMDFKAELIFSSKSEAGENGANNEMSMALKLTDPNGETLSAKLVTAWNEPLPQDEDPAQALSVMLYLDEMLMGGGMMNVTVSEPTGAALADGAYVEPAQMEQEAFDAFIMNLIKNLEAAIPVVQDIPAAA